MDIDTKDLVCKFCSCFVPQEDGLSGWCSHFFALWEHGRSGKGNGPDWDFSIVSPNDNCVHFDMDFHKLYKEKGHDPNF